MRVISLKQPSSSSGVSRWGRRRRNAAIALAAAATSLTFTAGTAEASATHQSSAVNITYWNMWSGKWTTLIDQLVAQFNASHPDIHVTALSVPSSNGDQKLLTAIAAGVPPSVFTEWNPEIGAYAYQKAIQPLNSFETGQYAGIGNWVSPVATSWATYQGKLYGLPMSMNSFMLYYNKTMLKEAGISSPPTTTAQLFTDQAKEWKYNGGRLTQFGMYPTTNWDQLMPVFNVDSFVNGKYDLATNKQAIAEMDWIAKFDVYPFSQVEGLETAVGNAGGGSVDAFVEGKAGFWISGAWGDPRDRQPEPDDAVRRRGNSPATWRQCWRDVD